jgi:predicted nucleotidyltransferase
MGTKVEESALQAAVDLLRGMGATEVFVFGSAAKGTLQPGSDIDLAVWGLPPRAYFAAASRAADLLGRPPRPRG